MPKKEINKTSIALILIAGLLGGFLGSLLYLSFIGWSNGSLSYGRLGDGQSEVIIRDPKKVVVEQDNKTAETITSTQSVLVGIFTISKDGTYDITNGLSQALIVTGDGWLLTNFNFSKPLSEFVVVSSDKAIYTLDKAVKDKVSGFTFFHIKDAKSLPVARFSSVAELTQGQSVVGVNWQGKAWLSAISGITGISHGSDTDFLQNIYLTDLPLNDYKNLAIVDLSGQIVGLVNLSGDIMAGDYFSSMTGKLLAGEKLTSAYLGASWEDLYFLAGVDEKQGVKITALAKNSPAVMAGLKVGDIITALDGTLLDGKINFNQLLLKKKPGDKIIIDYGRAEQTGRVDVVLGEAW